MLMRFGVPIGPTPNAIAHQRSQSYDACSMVHDIEMGLTDRGEIEKERKILKEKICGRDGNV